MARRASSGPRDTLPTRCELKRTHGPTAQHRRRAALARRPRDASGSAGDRHSSSNYTPRRPSPLPGLARAGGDPEIALSAKLVYAPPRPAGAACGPPRRGVFTLATVLPHSRTPQKDTIWDGASYRFITRTSSSRRPEAARAFESRGAGRSFHRGADGDKFKLAARWPRTRPLLAAHV